jgi:hypothetical protein
MRCPPAPLGTSRTSSDNEEPTPGFEPGSPSLRDEGLYVTLYPSWTNAEKAVQFLASAGAPEICQQIECPRQRVDAALAELGRDESADLSDSFDRDRVQALAFRCQVDALRAPVVGIGSTPNESSTLDQLDHRGHRLLREARAPRQLGHPEAVLFEEWYEHGPERWPHLWKTACAETLCEQLVPALRRLRQLKAEVLPGERPTTIPWRSPGNGSGARAGHG